MNVLIYGGGAVGLGIASCLIAAGARVEIISREDTVSALNKRGLLREGIFGSFRAEPGSFWSYSSLGDLGGGGFDYIIVSTKAHDSLAAARDLVKNAHLFGGTTKVVLFHNGWGSSDIFSSFFPEESIFNARVITGFVRPEKHRVEVTVHADAIHLGSLYTVSSSELADLRAAIAGGGIPCELTDEIGKDLWAKMLYNCALNALGAIFDVPYGMLGERESTRELMKSIVQEVFQVMVRSGHDTHFASPGDYLSLFYEKLLPPTAKHESSMLQDIREKKETEIDFLNGAVVSLGERADCPAPVNLTLSRMVKFLQSRAMSGRK